VPHRKSSLTPRSVWPGLHVTTIGLAAPLRVAPKSDVAVLLSCFFLTEPRRVFDKANLETAHEHVFLGETLASGLQLARDLLHLTPAGADPGALRVATS
jgi:hypothetical protein